MSFTPASQALARFKVLDLTRVRAGPTAARQLADWGADVIKIELPKGLDESDMGGPRHGPDFQNLHRNKRSLTLNLKEPDGVAIFKRMVETADVVIENYRPDVKFRLGIDYESDSRDQQAHRLWLDFRLRRGRSLSRAAGLRPDRARHGRADVDHGSSRPGPGARRHSRRRSRRRHFLRDGNPGRAAGARGFRRGSVGAVVAARRADLAAGFPGGALADRQGRAGPGRQRPPDQHSDRRVSDQRRPYQHRRRRQAYLQALLPDARACRICSKIPALPTMRPAPRTAPPSTRSSPRSQGSSRAAN